MSPSIPHELLVDLFRDFPDLAGELLEPLLGAVARGPCRIAGGALTDVTPAAYAADLVVLVGDDVPVLAIAVEVQWSNDPDKAFTWPVYAATLRARHRCPAVVLVVAPDEGVARKVQAPIDLGPHGTFYPVVFGPGAIPTDVARASPALTVLATLAHRDAADARPLLKAFREALDQLSEPAARIYYDLIASQLDAAQQRLLEDLMPKPGYRPLSEWGRKHYDEGLEKGTHDGQAELVIRLLARRVGLLDGDTKARITALSVDDLAALGEALLDFTGAADLTAWLDGSRPAP